MHEDLILLQKNCLTVARAGFLTARTESANRRNFRNVNISRIASGIANRFNDNVARNIFMYSIDAVFGLPPADLKLFHDFKIFSQFTRL